MGSVFADFAKGLNPDVYSPNQCLLPAVLARRWAGVTAQRGLFAGLSTVTGEVSQVWLGNQQLCPGEGEVNGCRTQRAPLGKRLGWKVLGTCIRIARVSTGLVWRK